jgi:hypothetical protein
MRSGVNDKKPTESYTRPAHHGVFDTSYIILRDGTLAMVRPDDSVTSKTWMLT